MKLVDAFYMIKTT